ncbi:hypothetical protein ACHAWT_005352 [Skeletonema menzelii]
MAKRANPSSSDSEEDAPEKKKSRTITTKQVSNGGGGSSKTSSRRRGIAKTAPAATNNKTIEPANNPQTKIAATSSVQVSGSSKGSVASFLKSARLIKSQTPDASDTTSKNTAADSKSDTKKNDPPLQDLNTDTSRRKSGIYLSVFLFAANLVSAAYIVSQHTFHNLAQMRCASTVNKLQLELSNTKDEMKLLRKAIETLEGGNTQLADSEDIIFGSRTIKDHKQLLKSDEIDAWQQSLNALEEDRLSAMNDFNEKLKSLH